MATVPGRASRPALVSMLEDWEAAGAHWLVVARTTRDVTIALVRCDGGEEVDRVSSTDPDVLSYLDGRASSET